MANYDWGSDELRDATTRYSEWYKAKLGYVDTIRIMDKAYTVFRHNWNQNGKFMSSMCSLEEHGSCPFCDRLPPDSRQPAFATTILHLLRRPNQADSKPKYIGRILAWRFGNDKKTDLVEINEVTGKRLRQVDLQIKIKGTSPEDEQYQKLQIIKLDKPVLDRLNAEIRKKIQELWKKQEESIRRLYLPTPDDLKARIKDDDEAVEFDPEKLEDETADAGLPFEEDSKEEGESDKKDALDVDNELEDLMGDDDDTPSKLSKPKLPLKKSPPAKKHKRR